MLEVLSIRGDWGMWGVCLEGSRKVSWEGTRRTISILRLRIVTTITTPLAPRLVPPLSHTLAHAHTAYSVSHIIILHSFV